MIQAVADKLKFHIPAMLNEVIECLDLKPGQVIVDATVGTGGHSKAIIECIMPGGRLIGIDRDEESLKVASERLKDQSGSCDFVHSNFSDIDKIVKELDIKKVDGVLFDLGISSFQLDDPERGFSFQNEGPLDMRLDRSSYISAYDLVNNLTEEEISALLWNFGQERWHNRIARFLVEERQKHPIATTRDLADIVVRSIPAKYRYGHHRIHPATRTFQAVRIAVNRELEILESSLEKAAMLLGRGGRVCAISFHSLEDRTVKHTFKRLANEKIITIITPKPLTPSPSEVEVNPRARSSKLRAAQKAR
jgi:16S rRNA (cytosine1402-N4)-methyltransferase